MESRLWIKVCGITRAEDAQEAADLGADALGFNFYPPSPRYVAPAAAREIVRAVPASCEAVGVVVHAQRADLLELQGQVGRLHTFQCHGEPATPDDADSFQVIAAFQIPDAASLETVNQYLHHCRGCGRMPRAILVDGCVTGLYGGTGKAAPWELLADYRPGVPMILAGGLTPDNVAEAIRLVRPYGVDVAGGVEREPGRKDAEKMRRFIGKAREAAAKCGNG
jgi:phosphoribosylanthranilate isomerase